MSDETVVRLDERPVSFLRDLREHLARCLRPSRQTPSRQSCCVTRSIPMTSTISRKQYGRARPKPFSKVPVRRDGRAEGDRQRRRGRSVSGRLGGRRWTA